MFVRQKKVKNNYYAYLVENSWNSGSVRQRVVSYLGPLKRFNKMHSTSFKDFLRDESSDEMTYLSLVRTIVTWELHCHGFEGNKVLSRDDIKVSLTNGNIQGKRPCVLALNGGYLYTANLRSLLKFRVPKMEKKRGYTLAKLFSDAGIQVDRNTFVTLYKKIDSDL